MMNTNIDFIRNTLITEYKPNGVIDFEYLEKYIDVCFNNATDKIKFKTENHHILPQKYFPTFKKEDWNRVNLSLYNHILAHFYLFKAFKNKHSLYSVCRVIGNACNPSIVEKLTIEDLLELSKLKEQVKLECRANLIANNPKRGTKLTQEQKDRIRDGNKNSPKRKLAEQKSHQRKWLHKENKERFAMPNEIDDLLADGYIFGRCKETNQKIGEKSRGRIMPESAKNKIRKKMLALGENHHMKTKEKREWAKTTINRFSIRKIKDGEVCFVHNDKETLRINVEDLSLYEQRGYKRGSNSRWVTSPDNKIHRRVDNVTAQCLLELGWRYGKV